MPDNAQAMNCPRCEKTALRAAMTPQGVEVDHCPSCGGVWLDKGEVFHFTRRPKELAAMIEEATRKGRSGRVPSPKTGTPMQKLLLYGGRLTVDLCRDTGGIWFDKDELRAIAAKDDIELDLTPPREAAAPQAGPAGHGSPEVLAAIAAAARPLPNLVLRSGGVLVILYGLLGLLLIACVEFAELPPGAAVIIGAAIVAFQFLLGPFLMDLSLRWFYHCRWVEKGEMPDHLRDFVQRLADRRRIRFPRFGLIDDGAPNAFTYGHHPNNARVVLTRGIYELLDEREVEGVVAHEIGHAVHWDMLVMTMAYLVPLVAFYVYRTLIRIRVRGKDKTAGIRFGIALTSYLVYIISEYLVLWLSRTREYWADRFAGEETGNPNALASALVKIGYGLAGQKRESASESEEGEEEKAKEPSRRTNLEAVGALGIFDPKAARCLAIASARGAAAPALNFDHLKATMRWDLWNPWAKFYELNSTHPLIANRLDHLGRQAAGLGQQPLVVFDLQKPECYWDEFLVDIAVMFLPFLMAVGALVAAIAMDNPKVYPLILSALGLGMLIKTLFAYRGGHFPETSIAGLLKNVKVSAVRGIPCTVRGTVIGRGVPGLIWSEDFVIQDETGILFLDYSQPFRIWELLFGLLRRRQLQDEPVEAVGWYRRAPMPYVELKSITCQGKKRRCYVYYVKFVVAALLIGAGIWLSTAL